MISCKLVLLSLTVTTKVLISVLTATPEPIFGQKALPSLLQVLCEALSPNLHCTSYHREWIFDELRKENERDQTTAAPPSLLPLLMAAP